MAEAKSGDTVKVHYTGQLQDGQVFDTTREDEPFEFTIGSGEVINGFEEAVVGMEPGQARKTTIPAKDAYGAHREDLVAEFGRGEFPDDLELEEGQALQIEEENGQRLVVRIVEVGDETVKLDGNHPLAGEDLTFHIELVDIA
jgi:FKBP-type peptidyl-prolyl cis-trans isomerase 2